MVDTTETRRAARGGSSAAALMPTGKPRAAPSPHTRIPTATTTWSATTTRPTKRPPPSPEHRRPPEAVEHDRADQPAGRHRGHEHREARDADPVLDVVAVDERQREPVVGRPLGHREASTIARSRGCAAPAMPSPWRLLLVGSRAGQERPGRDAARRPARRRPRTMKWSGIGTAAWPRHADARPHDGAQAQARVEPRHDRPAQAALDLGALDVHRDVPHPVPTP